jgi:GNAT superfamily N-acetyltransferase
MEAALVELGQAQRPDAISTLVSAFIGDPVERWLYPSASGYFAHFGRFVEAFAGQAFESRTAWAIEDGTPVALWLPPGTTPDGGAIGRVLAETVAQAKHADTFEVLGQMAAAHPTYPHWYLALMGVDPAVQGHGFGSRLLESGLQRVDSDHLPAYLETPNPDAVPLYERYGFIASARAQAGKCPPIVSMVRAAR